MAETATFWGLSFSPWTEKARWAVEHHRLPYRYREHTPLLGEPALRLRARKRPAGRPASVPLLIDAHGVWTESDAIARHAEAVGSGAPLFSAEHDPAIDRWASRSDEALRSVRALVLAAMNADTQAQVELVPPLVPGPLRAPMRGISAMGIGFLARKYDTDPSAIAAHTATVSRFCEAVEASLGDGEHLLGDALSYADIVAAVVINGILPLERTFADMPATRRTWTRPELAERFAALVAWRDRLYAAHRP
ncbi:glutathione S-transferase family protein [Pseudenhygromyxa sp. WMMC2535]|uniref:glutathione S-transferase family protein n=1 Tax=Pseudenhygromyxa sp. WMMC2535 TaxID=2712867 RepID=UPI0015575140|nr:glutathione S-transferase family protein [Pseudenhygromyxa sp. WMMC2535]NVB42539.1 glutathione S-transferase family protein [Pseudenhygromyxa sp. WMMC2535]